MRMIVGCEYSGTVREAFKARGWDAWSCDILPTEIPGNHIQGDLLEVIHDDWDLAIFHPPCTYFSCAGMHYLKTQADRQDKLKVSFDFLLKLWNAPIPKICIENPQGWLNTNWRKPTQIIQPFYFGDGERKKTCLWLKNLSRLNGLRNVAMNVKQYEPQPSGYRKIGKDGYRRGVYFCGRIDSKVGRSDQKKAAHLKAKTFPGIARAMAAQWST